MTKKTMPSPKVIEFTFEIYSYFPGYKEKLFLEGNTLIFLEGNPGTGEYNVVSHIPSAREWGEFSRSLDNHKIWKWRKNYINLDIVDGGGWNLFIETNSSIIESHGVNKRPSHFNKFLESINKLMGVDIFEIYP